jgi:hypothetical protein
MTNDNIQLKVLEGYTRDICRGVARIDYSDMDKIGASTGDVIEIIGKRRTVGKCLPLYPSDEGKGIIRMDGLVRNNAGPIIVGDIVTINKTQTCRAEKVVVWPLEAIPPIDERYLADALESVSITVGDNIMVPYFGGRLAFTVSSITANDDTVRNNTIAAIVTQQTVFKILDKETEVKEQKEKQQQQQIDAVNKLVEVIEQIKASVDFLVEDRREQIQAQKAFEIELRKQRVKRVLKPKFLKVNKEGTDLEWDLPTTEVTKDFFPTPPGQEGPTGPAPTEPEDKEKDKNV